MRVGHRIGKFFVLLVAFATMAIGGLVSTTAPAQAAESNELAFEFQWQQNGWYCGPAATRMALTARGIYHSQDTIAGYLGTTEAGTASAANTTYALNALGNTGWYETKWIGGSMATQEQIDLLKWDIVFDIDRGYPLVVNIVGSAMDTDGDWHSYPGGHYLAVTGYSHNGEWAKIGDSADANGYGWYWIETTRLAHWIAGRGYSA